jgi:hypothetical protein
MIGRLGRDAARVAYEEQGNTTKFFRSANRPIMFSNSYTSAWERLQYWKAYKVDCQGS